MPGLPPLQLSSGPAISGAPNSSGGASTGDFIVNKRNTWKARLALVLPMMVAGGALWLMTRGR